MKPFPSEKLVSQAFVFTRNLYRYTLDVVVGTPGRLIKHVEEGNLYLSGVTHVILDEADTLFEAGFGDEVRRLLRPLQQRPEGKQCVIGGAVQVVNPVQPIALASAWFHNP
jgi:superfamily II DNA/RNA helicase